MAPRKPKTLSLTPALSQLLGKTLLPDLRTRAQEPAIEAALQHQYDTEKKAERTADSFRAFAERTLEQVGAAWILSCVFVRTLEDRKLLARNRLAGDGAADSEQLFFELAPSLTARDYLLTVFQEVSSLPGVEDVLGAAHNPVFRLSPSNEGARALLDFFRECGEDGALRWQFAGEDTRVLGDLYQDLSEDVRKRYALLQTPHFVESFILDQTLTPAIAEFGLNEVRVIDPTCGSGHFLLGAFERLVDERLRTAPGVDVRTHALAALGQVYGVDMNPYAVAIARFRLTLAYLARAGFARLSQAPRLKLNLVVADSLLHGAKDTSLLFTEHESARGDEAAWGLELFALDDAVEAARVFNQRYHAVVGNPPYITCKDKALRDAYRKLYKSCHREYSLAAPFTERFFQLAVDSGYVGLINANSFMKREFGSALIEKVLPMLDLTRVIDTAGAYIPGHGTPTVLLFGRNRKPASDQVSAVLGKRGEPSTPEDPEQGLVWRSIVDHYEGVGFDNDYVTVAAVPRSTLNLHPWSLGGGGAAELKELLETRAEKTLVAVVDSIGFMAITKQDDVFSQPPGVLQRHAVEADWINTFVIGEHVRDWSIQSGDEVVFPYTQDGGLRALADAPGVMKFLWPQRTNLENRAVFGGQTFRQSGRAWHAYGQIPPDRIRGSAITFAFVATHNHFVLDRGGKVFNRTAPIIKLPESATEDDHLALLAYLNSSTACFWMKQVFFPKYGAVKADHPDPARNFYEFAGTALSNCPLVPSDFGGSQLAGEIVDLAVRRERLLDIDDIVEEIYMAKAVLPTTICEERWKQSDALRRRMVFLQEEIDWRVYASFGLVGQDCVLTDEEVQAAVLARGQRAFERDEGRLSLVRHAGELLLACDAEMETAPPPELSAVQTRVKGARRNAVARSPSLQLIEINVHKRLWRDSEQNETERQYRAAHVLRVVHAAALRTYEEVAASELVIRSCSRAITTEFKNVSMAEAISAAALRNVIAGEAVPFLAEHRFAPAGLEKHAEWKRTWDLQRREDLGESVGEIPVPPKYDSKDYQSPDYWRLRGKLDVPKERFISYPGCQNDGDDSPLIGWAGWNHLQRAQALIALYQERKQEDGWPNARLMPMLVGLHELMFWLELWHSTPEAGSQNPAREVRQYLDAELNAHKLTASDLEAWRPETKQQAKARKSAKPTTE